MTKRTARIGLAIALALALVAGVVVVVRSVAKIGRTNVVAYFDNSNGIFRGDDVYMLGVPIGEIDKIEPQPDRAKITFWFDEKIKVPADAKAVILSPQLITSRAIQLTPAYTGGPEMTDDAVIPQDRTAVPVEWDDFRKQLEKLNDSLQPGPDGISPLGAFINTTADNLRGQGGNIRDAVIKLSQAVSTLGDHSKDVFATFRNISILVSALHDSADLMRQLNQNLAAVSALFANDGNELGDLFRDLGNASDDLTTFVGDNREALGTTSDRLAGITQALVDSIDDLKQTLHVFPNAFQNFVNIYEPAHASLTGALAVNNFANPISFLCGAIQAASRLGAEQSSKLCVQYLAPIIKNRQYNFPPLGLNPFVNAQARPNEVTFSEEWMRPDYIPPLPPAPDGTAPLAADAPPAAPPPDAPQGAPLAAEAQSTVATDPAAGLPGMMVPPGGGS
jgi:phospholipid/cholesterol/gamma-HCH transport system substrate-binding protein